MLHAVEVLIRPNSRGADVGIIMLYCIHIRVRRSRSRAHDFGGGHVKHDVELTLNTEP